MLGGEGSDKLKGGSGTDRFDFNGTAESNVITGRDVIFDFDANGMDLIDLFTIDAVAGGANDAFTFIGNTAFTGLGQIRVFQISGNTVIDANTTGTNSPDMRIVLKGLVMFDVADFVL